jgi:protein-S-isoprenylcysteine O-methyltransferase Ste14
MGKENSTIRKSFWPVFGLYFLITFEFFYMASPFAVYFYTIYKPALGLLDKIPFIAKLTGFFLPHLVEETNSVLLNLVKPSGALITLAGLTIFFVCAGQVYYNKIFHKGMVSGGLYRFIRHPQYLAFAVCGFGLLLLWPRYLVLVMYITLLFVYYFLARYEEKECACKFGQSYIDYVRNTFMFLPFRFSFLEKINNNRWIKNYKRLITMGLYISTILFALLIAHGIKYLSVHELYTAKDKYSVTVSIYDKSIEEMNQIINIAKSDSRVDEFLKKVDTTDKLINYIYPAGMYISEIPMTKPDSASCHVFDNKFNADLQAIMFTKAMVNSGVYFRGIEILDNAVSVNPIVEVWIDINERRIAKILPPINVKRYENIPEPVF